MLLVAQFACLDFGPFTVYVCMHYDITRCRVFCVTCILQSLGLSRHQCTLCSVSKTWDIILVLEQTGELSVHATLCACFWRQLLLFLLLPVCAFAALNIITAPYAFQCEWRSYL